MFLEDDIETGLVNSHSERLQKKTIGMQGVQKARF